MRAKTRRPTHSYLVTRELNTKCSSKVLRNGCNVMGSVTTMKFTNCTFANALQVQQNADICQKTFILTN